MAEPPPSSSMRESCDTFADSSPCNHLRGKEVLAPLVSDKLITSLCFSYVAFVTRMSSGSNVLALAKAALSSWSVILILCVRPMHLLPQRHKFIKVFRCYSKNLSYIALLSVAGTNCVPPVCQSHVPVLPKLYYYRRLRVITMDMVWLVI